MQVPAFKIFGVTHKINEENVVHLLVIIKSGHNYYNQ